MYKCIIELFPPVEILLVIITVLIICDICNWILFQRAGYDGWKSIIPGYNIFIMCKIAFNSYDWAFAWLVVVGTQFILSVICGILISIYDISIYDIRVIYLLYSLVVLITNCLSTVISGIILFFFVKSYNKAICWSILAIFFSPIILLIMVLDNKTQYTGSDSFGRELFNKIKIKFGK